jgi:hypothetical protein
VTVEDNGPIPRQLRLSIANGSERIPVSITVPLSGRFTTSWPEGERRLDFSNVVDPLGLEAVNALPEGYALKSARQGNADILTEPLKLVAGGTVNVEITLHVTLPMFAVSGRLEAPSRSATRMILTPDRASPGALSRNPLEAVIAADGSFEFPRVLPGKYMLRGNTDAPGASVNVNVIDGDVRGVIIRATGG